MSYVLGIDLGTSSLKGILMDEAGQVICEKSSGYGIDTPANGYSEQRPEYWVVACEDVLTQLSIAVSDFGEKLAGISFSGQMHSLVTLDADFKPAYPAILWNDVRTTKQCEQIMSTFGERLLSITQNIALEGFTLPKILWLQENEPAIWQKVKKIMLPKDYLSFWFTGEICTEYSDAAGTLLLDIQKRAWSDEILNQFAISKDILPKLIPSMDRVGIVKEEICKRYNIKNEVSVFAGGADNACAALASGIADDEIGLVSIGTSGVFSSFEDKVADYQGKLHFFNHVIEDKYYSMGVTLAAGNSLSWFKETFAKGISFEDMLKDVYQIAPGSDGLMFTPYIAGERTPHIDSQVRGSFIGIDTKHTFNHFARAVMEGITFSLKDSQMIMEQAKQKKFKKLISVGGGAKNPDWMQMQADIFDAEMIRLSVEQGPGLGACMIAAMGLGWFETVEDLIKTFVDYKQATFTPNKENVAIYQAVYQKWQQIYQATKDF
ncbi:xylulokinase [Enterococcus columbae]|uniref:Xylulose kinase n=1 Tax=Enterococcus columbae DSM 7374 = ATCC 51263 TaxID=1121865 RepID=S1NIQ1_9ENTE|nr:xylulokinase [Enterococcus columbae]EOT41759.1 xylulokinase [Enterococcus columbae DSM 7374 = ATCC 51263]EOW80689.1 xylulokinase [Enterococcus columbae DSM 7374 = ATCC 51263]OJG21937.1 xylulokinase [Enterococcus columbae DSM 7374 = ATCC 51263]